MKCTNRKTLKVFFCIMLSAVCLLSGCGSLSYEMEYHADSEISSFNVISKEDKRTAAPYASNFCVITGDKANGTEADLSVATAAVLLDLNRKEVLYAKNAHRVLYPASITKIMTALVAIRYGRADQLLTATNVVNITESGATLCGLKAGDTMTMDQALRILLVYSANDVAMMIAENVGGTVEHFVEMMNEEAQKIGATNTHFSNPNGLTDENHYTTVYDLYLIFNEALKEETLSEIIQMTGYQTVYYDKNNKEKTFEKKTTNGYLNGNFTAPSNVTVIGGKTGTTIAAGHCLLLLVRDVNGSPYIAIVMGTPSTDELYRCMSALLGEINRTSG
ncbi:MAG: D-alanyl-D-alanine carboxypeptidase family protein [Acetatifactor sp.]